MQCEELQYGITIVIPGLDEEALVYEVTSEIHSVVTQYFRNFELLLVNDGSKDGTGSEMERFAKTNSNARVVHNLKNKGLGAAYKLAIEEAEYRYCMLLCADGGMPASSLPAIFQKIGEAQIIAPYVTNLRQIKTPTRYFTSRVYTGLLNLLFGQRIHYYNGCAVHRTDLLRQITIQSSRFAFQGEVLTKLLKAGCSCVQVGVLGAEKTNRSSALRIRNLANVARTLVALVVEVSRFDNQSVKLNGVCETRTRHSKASDV